MLDEFDFTFTHFSWAWKGNLIIKVISYCHDTDVENHFRFNFFFYKIITKKYPFPFVFLK